MHCILFPTDFSQNTNTALDYAIDLANQFSCKLILLNTYKLSHRGGMFIGAEKEMRKESREQMATLVKKVKKKLEDEATLEGKVVKGEAISTIIQAAKKLEVSMIVMGTQGANGLKEVFIGSTTNGVMKGAKIPVLVVPSEFEYRPLKSIALSIDEKIISSKISLESLRMIIYRYDAKVCSFHISSSKKDKTNEMEDELSSILEGINFSFSKIDAGEVGINQKIEAFVVNEKADMLCMIKRDRGFWGNLFHSSVTTKEVFHSSVPLLVLHD